jgi:hypothetical protein
MLATQLRTVASSPDSNHLHFAGGGLCTSSMVDAARELGAAMADPSNCTSSDGSGGSCDAQMKVGGRLLTLPATCEQLRDAARWQALQASIPRQPYQFVTTYPNRPMTFAPPRNENCYTLGNTINCRSW